MLLEKLNKSISDLDLERALQYLEELKQSNHVNACVLSDKQEEVDLLEKRIVLSESDPELSFLRRFIIITPTCAINKRKRAAIESTWGALLAEKGVRHYYVIGAPDTQQSFVVGKTLYVPCRDDYESLLLKLILAYDFVIKRIGNFTHIVKIDDDCYLNVFEFSRHAKNVLESDDYIGGAVHPKEERINRRWHFGKCSDTRYDIEYHSDFPGVSYAKGGYGYFLSRRSIICLSKKIDVFRRELDDYVYSYEDMRIGQVLIEDGIAVRGLNGYSVDSKAASEIWGKTLVYDISEPREFNRFHQQLAFRFLQYGMNREFVDFAFVNSGNDCSSLGFDHVYVVNLRKSVKRRMRVCWELDKHNIDYCVFDGFNGGSSLTRRILEDVISRPVGELGVHGKYAELEKFRGRKFIETDGVIGYVLAYVRVLEDAKQKGFGKILILEDDIMLCREFERHLGELIEKIDGKY